MGQDGTVGVSSSFFQGRLRMSLDARLFGVKAAGFRQKPSTSACYIDNAYTIMDNVAPDTTNLFYFNRLQVPKNEAI